MTLFSTIFIIASFIGALGFACWDNDIELPVLYPYGAFLADWWFHDKLKPGKPHLEKHELAGPPLVAKTGEGGQIMFPYTGSTTYSGGYFFTPNYDEHQKRGEEYTPVNGLYGVTNQKESDPTQKLEYYPNAANPNDYISRRLLGPQSLSYFDYQGVDEHGKELYNRNAFTEGTPFSTAIIGPNKPNDPRWGEATQYLSVENAYPLMIPLTTDSSGHAYSGNWIGIPGSTMTFGEQIYSGGEYNEGDVGFAASLEEEMTVPFRPPWYPYRQNYTQITGNNIGSFPGEGYQIQAYGSGNTMITPSFVDQFNDGMTFPPGITTVSWGDPGNSIDSETHLSSTDIQKQFIYTNLSQEDPIASRKPSKVHPTILYDPSSSIVPNIHPHSLTSI